MNALHDTAARMVADGRGILAADESVSTMSKRLAGVGVESTEENRRRYRELLLTTPGLAGWISGVILCDETFHQRLADGRTFPEAARALGILPGIKVDAGPKALALVPGAQVTEGLDGLRERLASYAQDGAAFAKWRAVLTVGGPGGGDEAVDANAHALARYAALCQEAGIVPIIEPEVLMDGDHGLAACAEQTTRTLTAVFAAVRRAHVDLAGSVLKPNMVVAGTLAPRAEPTDVARATLAVLETCVPAELPGIAFLSGGQDNHEATANLAAMNATGRHPWHLTFSFGRALVSDALAEWAGRGEHVAAAQATLADHCGRAARAATVG